MAIKNDAHDDLFHQSKRRLRKKLKCLSSCWHTGGERKAGSHYRHRPSGFDKPRILWPELTHHLSVDETLAAVFDEEQFVSADSLVRLTSVQGIGVIPSNHLLSRHNQPSPENNGLKQFVLRDLVESISGWDFVLIDCPPNLYLCSWNAMIASDYVVIPVPPEDFGTQGIRIVHQAIASASRLNPGLTLLSHLVTRMDRRLIVHRAYETRLRESYGHQIFTTVIPDCLHSRSR